jgi:hypothetical protein
MLVWLLRLLLCHSYGTAVPCSASLKLCLPVALYRLWTGSCGLYSRPLNILLLPPLLLLLHGVAGALVAVIADVRWPVPPAADVSSGCRSAELSSSSSTACSACAMQLRGRKTPAGRMHTAPAALWVRQAHCRKTISGGAQYPPTLNLSNCRCTVEVVIRTCSILLNCMRSSGVDS